MIWITAEDVIQIHGRVIQGSGGMDGLRERDGLRNAPSFGLSDRIRIHQGANAVQPAFGESPPNFRIQMGSNPVSISIRKAPRKGCFSYVRPVSARSLG